MVPRSGRLRLTISPGGPAFRVVVYAAQSILLTILLTWPTIRRLDDAVLGCIESDTMKHLWTLWWFRHMVLVDGALPFQTDYVNYPAGMEIWPIEPLHGLISLGLASMSVVTLSNALALVNLTLNGICGALFGREITGDMLGGLVVGLLIQTSTFALFTLHVGVGELQHFWILPLGFLALRRVLHTRRWAWVVGLGVILGLGTLACFYHGFFLGTGLLVLGVAALIRRRGHLAVLARLVVAALIGLSLVVPLSRAFPSTASVDQATVQPFFTYVFEEGHGQPLSDPVKARLEPEDLLLGRADEWDDKRQDLSAYAGGRLLGFPILILAAIALWRWPRRALPWLAVGGVGVGLGLGSHLSTGGNTVLMGEDPIRLPFLFLNRALWFVVEPVHFPVRFLALTQVALAAMGGMAVMATRGRWRWILVALAVGNVADIQIRQLLPYPLVSFELEDQSFLAEVKGQPDGAMLDLTGIWGEDAESRRLVMTAQVAHGRQVQSVPVDRLEFYARDGRLFAESLKFVEDLSPGYRGDDFGRLDDYRGDLFTLREAGFRLVMVNSQGLKIGLEPALLAAMSSFLGPPISYTEYSALFRIPDVVASEAQQAEWREEYAERLADTQAADPMPGPSLDQPTKVDTVGDPDRSPTMPPGPGFPGAGAGEPSQNLPAGPP